MKNAKIQLMVLVGALALEQMADALELDRESFAEMLPAPGAAPLLLFLSRPGCSVCEQLEEKWDGIATGVGSLATLATMNCDPDKGNERFCFSMQSSVRG